MKDINLILDLMRVANDKGLDCGIECVEGIFKLHIDKVMYVGQPEEVVVQILNRLS